MYIYILWSIDCLIDWLIEWLMDWLHSLQLPQMETKKIQCIALSLNRGWVNEFTCAWNTLQHCGTAARHLQLPCKPLPRWFQPLPSCMKYPVYVWCRHVSSIAAKAESSCSDWSSQPESGIPVLNPTASFVTLRCTFSSSTAARSAMAPSQSIESWGSSNPTFGGGHKLWKNKNSTAPWNQDKQASDLHRFPGAFPRNLQKQRTLHMSYAVQSCVE